MNRSSDDWTATKLQDSSGKLWQISTGWVHWTEIVLFSVQKDTVHCLKMMLFFWKSFSLLCCNCTYSWESMYVQTRPFASLEKAIYFATDRNLLVLWRTFLIYSKTVLLLMHVRKSFHWWHDFLTSWLSIKWLFGHMTVHLASCHLLTSHACWLPIECYHMTTYMHLHQMTM